MTRRTTRTGGRPKPQHAKAAADAVIDRLRKNWGFEQVAKGIQLKWNRPAAPSRCPLSFALTLEYGEPAENMAMIQFLLLNRMGCQAKLIYTCTVERVYDWETWEDVYRSSLQMCDAAIVAAITLGAHLAQKK